MRNEAFYNSAGFLEKANQSASLLSALQPYLDGRPVNLENMVRHCDPSLVRGVSFPILSAVECECYPI